MTRRSPAGSLNQNRLSAFLRNGLLTVLALYAVFWAALVGLGWLGVISGQVYALDVGNALALVPVWTRWLIFLWAILLSLSAAASLAGHRSALAWLLAALPVHVTVFLTLSLNPYYDGTVGYLNISLELIAAYLLYRAGGGAHRGAS